MSVSNDNFLLNNITRTVNNIRNVLNSFHEAKMQVHKNTGVIPDGPLDPTALGPSIVIPLDEGTYDFDFVVHLSVVDTGQLLHMLNIIIVNTDTDEIIKYGAEIAFPAIDVITTIYMHETIHHIGGNLNLGLGVSGNTDVEVAIGNFIVSVISY